MLAKLNTLSLLGIEALPVEVEVDVSSSPLPKTMLVGLPEQAVKESIHRVERAIVNSGFSRPNDRVVINLAPAELPKQAASFDLPISLGILAGSGQFQSDRFLQYAVVGELALEGHTRRGCEKLTVAGLSEPVCFQSSNRQELRPRSDRRLSGTTARGASKEPCRWQSRRGMRAIGGILLVLSIS